MSARARRKQSSRADTRALKASRLTAVLGEAAASSISSAITDEEVSGIQTDASHGNTEAKPAVDIDPEAIKLAALKSELQTLRRQLDERSKEYRSLTGKAPRASQTVAKVIALLSDPGGVTKLQLAEQTGAKRGYVDALLNRILPARGHIISSEPLNTGRGRLYRILCETPENAKPE